MNPSRQKAESQKYIAVPHIVVPTDAGFEVFTVHGAHREYIGLLHNEQALGDYLAAAFDSALTTHLAKPTFTPGSGLSLDLDLDIELDF